MRRAVVAAGLVSAVLLASMFVLRERKPAERRSDVAEPTDVFSIPAADIAPDGDAVAARSGAARDPAAIDLRESSETYRNSTLVFAIRRAGFVCADVVAAHESVEGVWVARCSDVVNYIVTLRGSEQFDVHPVPYGDSLAPFPIPYDESVIPIDRNRSIQRLVPSPRP
jgi:hypothetical protein